MRSSATLALLFTSALCNALPAGYGYGSPSGHGSPPVPALPQGYQPPVGGYSLPFGGLYNNGAPPPPVIPPTGSYNGVPPAVTESPPAGSEVPPTETEVPPTATEVPPTETEVPPTETEVPPTETDVPPTETDVPPTVTEVPPTETDVPPTETEVPPTVTEVPPIETEVPPTETDVPPTETEVPPTETEVPPTETDVPPTETEVPPTVTEVPPSEAPYGSEVPPTTTEVPPSEAPYGSEVPPLEGASYGSKGPKGPNRLPKQTKAIECRVTDSGFEPKEMSVKKGDTVTFKFSGGSKYGIRNGGDATSCVPLATPTGAAAGELSYTVPRDASDKIYFYNVIGDKCTKTDMSATLNVDNNLVTDAVVTNGTSTAGDSTPVSNAASNLSTVALVGALTFLATLVQL